MISRSATLVVGLMFFAAALAALLLGRERRQPQLLAPVPFAIPFAPPSSGFLESKVADLVRSATLVPSATESSSAVPNPATPTQPEGTSGALQKPSDLLFLERQASRLAYVYYGRIGETPVATFFDSLKKEQLTKAEGDVVYGLRIASVTHGHVLLAYGNASPLRKPRVDIEIDPRPDFILTPQEREALQVRFEELWGNRAKIQPEEEADGPVIPPFIPPGLPAEGDPRERYLETFGPFLEKLQATDPEVDPQNDPLIPTVEDLIRMRQQGVAAELATPPNPVAEDEPSR